jgi:hypothetical protein
MRARGPIAAVIGHSRWARDRAFGECSGDGSNQAGRLPQGCGGSGGTGTREDPRRSVLGCGRGSQYTSELSRVILFVHGLIGSMSRRGNPYDNAKAETFLTDRQTCSLKPSTLKAHSTSRL